MAMGFQAKNIFVAIAERKFNDPMATYLILEHTKQQERKCSTIREPLPPGVPTCPSPSTDVSTFPLPPKWAHRKLACQTFNVQPPEEVQESGQKTTIPASSPASRGSQTGKPGNFSEIPRVTPWYPHPPNTSSIVEVAEIQKCPRHTKNSPRGPASSKPGSWRL
ncbi:hypothetical protein P7K49_030773 [Saguinus oedipus]|uniref:Uncharacterized protein n=1 Tax=Saguinus oedipus TaxID=9490 RepID=A0ABQ9U344_SAGOE|nr:hypothetical protein P7K49_030773 [Saguinus oedipus]